jgi:SAM-dependent methyltransferase
MAERAHPADFRHRWEFRFRRRWIPSVTRVVNPYREAFFWRYLWVSKHAQSLDVLDVPCGMGWGTSLIKGARSIVGIDVDLASIEEAARRYSKHARFIQGDMASLNFPNDSFDLVACLEGIEHVSVQVGGRFLSETARVLRSKGLLLLTSPYCSNGRHSGNPYHVHEYQPEELRGILSTDFSIEDTFSRNVDSLTVQYLKCRKRR